jgi:drug/metabolite transporter (DMT)-like permease
MKFIEIIILRGIIVGVILYLLLLLLSLIWGFSFLFIKILLSYFTPITIVFLRSLLGTMVILVIMIIKGKKIIPDRESYWILITIGIFNSVLPWTLIIYSETLISSSMASVLNATTPIWTIFVGLVFFKSRILLIQWLGILIGFFGILILMGININHLAIDNLYGFMGMILASFFYGLAAQLSRRFFKNITVYQISLFTLLSSTIISSFFLYTNEEIIITQLFEPVVLIPLIGLGIFSSGIAYILYYYLIQKGSAEFASLVSYLVPITAMFWGVTIMGEEISFRMIIGLILILLGVFVSGQKDKAKLKKKDVYLFILL